MSMRSLRRLGPVPVAAVVCITTLPGCAATIDESSTPAIAAMPVARAAPAPTLTEAQALADMRRALEAYADLDDGLVADYSELSASVDPSLFAIAVATVDGEVWSVGDDDALFALQSLSKAFTLALAIEDRGGEAVLERVGLHATGLPFGSMAAMEIRATPLQNPMVSAGAIATTSLVAGREEAERWRRTRAFFSACAAREIGPIDAVFRSETEGADGSLAKAYALSSMGLLYAEPRAVVERYLRSCATGVTARDLAVMGATLGAGGVNPVTGERAMSRETAQGVLSAMVTAGMYDDSGPWFFRTGLPAKSGVSGGVVAVAPGRLAIAVYSPRLDSYGNSVRAQAVIEDLAARWALHTVGALLPAARDGAAAR